MHRTFFVKILMACLAMGLSLGFATASETKDVVVKFASVHEGKEPQQAKGIVIDEKGRFATIAHKDYNPEKATVDGKELKMLLHDPISKLTILELPADLSANHTAIETRGKSSELRPGDALITEKSNVAPLSRMVSFVRRRGKRILPLTFLRINYSGEAPVPGTPIYDVNHSLVGFAYQKSSELESMYVTPIEVLANLELAIKEGRKFQPCWIGVSLDSMSDAPVVMGVRPDTPAKRAGLQKGDVILSINGVGVGSYAEVVNAFFLLQQGQKTPFKILRGSEVKVLQVEPEVNPLVHMQQAQAKEESNNQSE